MNNTTMTIVCAVSVNLYFNFHINDTLCKIQHQSRFTKLFVTPIVTPKNHFHRIRPKFVFRWQRWTYVLQSKISYWTLQCDARHALQSPPSTSATRTAQVSFRPWSFFQMSLCLRLQTTTINKYESEFVDRKIGMLLYEKIFQWRSRLPVTITLPATIGNVPASSLQQH